MENTTHNPVMKGFYNKPPGRTDFHIEIYISTPGKSKIFGALSKFQSKCEHPKKTATNPFFKSKYAPLDSCITANQTLLGECGLSLFQTPVTKEGKLGLISLLTHSDGEYLQSEYFVKPDKDTAQGLGSAITYLRRYAYCSILGLAAEDDDDGNSASGSTKFKSNFEKTHSVTEHPINKNAPEIKIKNGGKEQLAFAEKRTLTKNDIQKKLKDECKTVPQQENLWVLLTKAQQENPEIKGWFSIRRVQIVNELEELKKVVNNDSKNEKAAELFAPDEKPDGMKFVNAIRLIETQEKLNEFYTMYKDAIMALPPEQYEMVSKELNQLESQFN